MKTTLPQRTPTAIDPEKLRLLTLFVRATACFSVLYGAYSWAIAYMPGVYIMAVNAVMQTLCLVACKRVRSQLHYAWCAHVFLAVGCFWGVMGSTYFSGGLYSPVIPWFALIPVTATLLFSATVHGKVWGGLALACVLGFSGLAFLDVPVPIHYDQRHTSQFVTVCLAGFVMLLFLLTRIFQGIKDHTLRELHLQNEALRQAHAEVKAAYLAKSRFLAAASHDLRQPAHALGLFVSRLNAADRQPPKPEVIHGLVASVQAMQELLDELFDYSRLESQTTPIEKRAVRLESIFKHLHLFFNNIAEAKGLRLRIRSTGAWVYSNPILLQRILLNLVSNALQYTHRGTVMVACRPCHDGRHVRLEVRDSGIGIDPALHGRVFEEFFQIQNPERDSAKGLGLGLSMVDRSCQLLDHPLALDSALGRGTRFTITVPLAPSGLNPRSNAEPDTPHWQDDLQDRRIWVIEDNTLGGAALKSLLESWGCSVRLFEEPEAALLAAQHQGQPDFVICDFRLRNDHNGIRAIQSIRTVTDPLLPACLISGDLEGDLRTAATEAGLVLLKKPVRAAKLRSLLRNGLRARRAQGLPTVAEAAPL